MYDYFTTVTYIIRHYVLTIIKVYYSEELEIYESLTLQT